VIYGLAGLAHARIYSVCEKLRSQAGQGTVEYVGLILLVGVVLAGVVKAGKGMGGDDLAKTVIGKLKSAIDAVKK